ncbi:MAG: hypothetical protein IIU25_03025 [Oscillospiraceae bacterium]|nr:hypothetical protein [Oscillospiraceae bacterium]
MDPLIKITSIPIDIEVNIKRASLEIDREAAKVNVSRDKGEFDIKAEPVTVNIDNTRMYSSLGFKKPQEFAREDADKGIRFAYQAVARVANEGDMLANGSAKPSDFAAEKAARTIEAVTGWLPENGPDITWNDGKLNINYTADKLNMDWETNSTPTFKFTPGSVEFIINQMPKVEIEYTGEPIYFPASADPNYQGE